MVFSHWREHWWSSFLLSRFSCVRLCRPVDHGPRGSSVHGILQERILEWVAMPSSRGSSPSRGQILVSGISCIGRRILYRWHHLVFFQSYTTLDFLAHKNRGYSGVTVKSSSLFALTTSPWYIAGPSSLYSVCFRVTVEYLGLKFSLHFYAVHTACPITVLITQRHSLLVEHLIPWPFHI